MARKTEGAKERYFAAKAAFVEARKAMEEAYAAWQKEAGAAQSGIARISSEAVVHQPTIRQGPAPKASRRP